MDFEIENYIPYAFALLLALPFFLLLKRFVQFYMDTKVGGTIVTAATGDGVQRVQAFERMVVFLDRVRPQNLVTKFDRNLKIHEFIFLTEKNIKEEFDYNSAQQLYLSAAAWQSIINARETVLEKLHETYEKTSAESSLEDYKSIFLLNFYHDGDAIQTAIDQLRKELLLLQQNS